MNTPLNNTINSPLAATFNWLTTEAAATYNLQIATDSMFMNLTENQSGLTDTTYNAALPNSSAVYYWRVKATNATGDSDWSATWKVTTEIMIGVEDLQVKYGLKVYPNPCNSSRKAL